MSIFGQLVIGPPGSGKTAYCHEMKKFLEKIGRKVAIVNVDPANEMLIYKANINISQLITLEDAMTTLSLGPNGGLMYCMEYLEKNIDWLLQQISNYKDHYFLFDCPGQYGTTKDEEYDESTLYIGMEAIHLSLIDYSMMSISAEFSQGDAKLELGRMFATTVKQLFQHVSQEVKFHMVSVLLYYKVELYTHHSSTKNITASLIKFGMHLCSVHLVDAHYCSDSSKFISTLMLSLSTMLQLELPHINVLSKIDILSQYGDKLQFGIDFYTEVLDLSYLLESLDEDPITRRYKKLNTALVSLVEDYSLVSFMPLNIVDKQCMLRLKNAIDKANGYIFGSGEQRNIQALLSSAIGAEFEQERTGYYRDIYSEDTDMTL